MSRKKFNCNMYATLKILLFHCANKRNKKRAGDNKESLRTISSEWPCKMRKGARPSSIYS